MRFLVAFMVCVAASASFMPAETQVLVEKGKAQSVRIEGDKWKPGDGFLQAGGINRTLIAGCDLGKGDFEIKDKIELETLDGSEPLVVPAGTQPGREFTLRGHGVPRLNGRGRGDLRVRVRVDVPTKLSDTEVDLLTQYAEGRGEEVGNGKEGLFSRIKSAFS